MFSVNIEWENANDSTEKGYSVVILDEAHERTVQTDILFGVVKEAQRRREESSMHPLKVYYTAQTQSDYLFASLVTLFQIHSEADPKGDVLIFLTGQDEIESAVRMIRDISRNLDQGLPRIVVYPLYAALPSQQQLRVFSPAPPGTRKVVVSTNIAETSVTISGIKYVIDSGRVKAKCNLSSVVLQLLGLGITRVLTFDFIDPPSEDSIVSAIEELHQLGAVDGLGDWQLTPLGRKMLAYPLEPRLSKVLLLAPEYTCLEEILTIVSMLSVDSVLVNPQNKRS
nr:hypothetical protein BaRGS_001915 [Batillaria attramentaria]